MKVVWERDHSTVRDVYETLLERRKIAYTTVMTMMKILEQKQYLKKTLHRMGARPIKPNQSESNPIKPISAQCSPTWGYTHLDKGGRIAYRSSK